MQASKIIKLGLTALKNNFTTLEHPYKLTFSISYWCQSRCLTCNIWQIKPKGELELNEIQEFARKNNFLKWIEITGGEPFLRKTFSIIGIAPISNVLFLMRKSISFAISFLLALCLFLSMDIYQYN